MVGKKVAQRAIAAGLAGMMSFGAMAPAALAIDERPQVWWDFTNVNDDDDLTYFRRISGDTRYDTMKKIVDATYRVSGDTYWHATTAVLASGDNFPDALAANGLAGALNNGDGAPVILTKKGTLSSQAKTLLEKMQVQHVYIMGGTAAVAQNVEDAIRDMKISTTRVAGADRQATSAEAFRLIDGNWYKAHGTHSVIVATGKNYADALSIAPFAYATGTPVVLTKDDGTLTEDQIKYIKDNDEIWQVVVVGGTEAVSDSVFSALGTYNGSYKDYFKKNYIAVRIAGADRYDTSANIADWEVNYALDTNNGGINNITWSGFSYDTTYVATGENFPDALAGAQLAGGKWYISNISLLSNRGVQVAKSFSPILLTKNGNRAADYVITKNLSWNYDTVRVDSDVYANFADYMKAVLNRTPTTAKQTTDMLLSFADTYKNGFYTRDSIRDYVTANPNTGLGLDGIPVGIISAVDHVENDNFTGIIFGGRNAVSKDKAKELDDAVKDSILHITDGTIGYDDYYYGTFYNRLIKDLRARNFVAGAYVTADYFKNELNVVGIPWLADMSKVGNATWNETSLATMDGVVANFYYSPIDSTEVDVARTYDPTGMHIMTRTYNVKFAEFQRTGNAVNSISGIFYTDGFTYKGDVVCSIQVAYTYDANWNITGTTLVAGGFGLA